MEQYRGGSAGLSGGVLQSAHSQWLKKNSYGLLPVWDFVTSDCLDGRVPGELEPDALGDANGEIRMDSRAKLSTFCVAMALGSLAWSFAGPSRSHILVAPSLGFMSGIRTPCRLNLCNSLGRKAVKIALHENPVRNRLTAAILRS